MARVICRICLQYVPVGERTRHLKTHGIDASYKGAVKQYFEEAKP